jgi:hypothetical protein
MTGIRIMARIGRLRQQGERGAVLLTVIGIGAVLMLIVTAVLGMAAGGTVKSNSDQDYQNAGAAAYAGLADYQARISADNSYEQYGNLSSTFATGSTFTPVDAGSPNDNPAFTTTKGGKWVGVAGSDNAASGGKRDGNYREWFRYEVNNANYYGQGVVLVRVTGKAGKVTRSLVANLKGTGFINYLYFTDYESGDPSLSNSSCTPLHWNETAAKGQTPCDRIQFASGDTLSGPVRTNDEFTICGAKFLNDVQSTAAEGAYFNPGGCGAPTFAKNSTTGFARVQHVSSIGLPPTNTNMRQETRTDLTNSTVPQPGCLYTGPTSIKFTGDGKMTVYSPWTQYTNIVADPTDKSGTQKTAQCGTPGYVKTGNTLGSPGGQVLDVPKNNLVYVQNVPLTADINNWGTKTPPNYSCTGADGSTAGNGVGYPAKGEDTSTIKITDPYNCKRGDAFVQGTFKGALTVVAQNYVYATGDIKYLDSGASANPNLLGLVGQKAVIVWNPAAAAYCYTSSSGTKTCAPLSYVKSDGSLASPDSAGYKVDREIDAAIASNTGTFTVQNYDQGLYGTRSSNTKMYGQGTLTILGSIAQKFRGPVATTSGSGFDKAYGYDKRLLTTAPPKFLQPVATTYGPTTQVEVKPAFSADGTQIS